MQRYQDQPHQPNELSAQLSAFYDSATVLLKIGGPNEKRMVAEGLKLVQGLIEEHLETASPEDLERMDRLRELFKLYPEKFPVEIQEFNAKVAEVRALLQSSKGSRKTRIMRGLRGKEG